MSEAVTEPIPDPSSPISLSASSWYLWRRVVAMSVLPIAFSLAFFYDWKWGYPPKKEQWEFYQEWKRTNPESDSRQWFAIAEKNGYDTEPDEMTDEKITGQLHWGIGTGVVGLGLLIYFLLSYPKKLQADAGSFTPPWGPRVPFSAIKTLDRRPWKLKGLAYAHYALDGGKVKKAVIDDLRFPGADAVLTRVQAAFVGEILDLEEEVEEETPAQAAEDTVPEEAETPNKT
jgi:hypothetical protein